MRDQPFADVVAQFRRRATWLRDEPATIVSQAFDVATAVAEFLLEWPPPGYQTMVRGRASYLDDASDERAVVSFLCDVLDFTIKVVVIGLSLRGRRGAWRCAYATAALPAGG